MGDDPRDHDQTGSVRAEPAFRPSEEAPGGVRVGARLALNLWDPLDRQPALIDGFDPGRNRSQAEGG